MSTLGREQESVHLKMKLPVIISQLLEETHEDYLCPDKTDPFRPTNGTLSAARMREAVERVRATREAVGPDVDILIECHGFLNPNTAIRVGQMLEEFSPFFYEESAPPENVDEMAKVAAA